MPTSTVLRFLAASTSTLLLAAYATAGNAAGLVEGAPGLIGDQTAIGTYRPAFSIALRKAAGDDAAGIRAGGFCLGLEAVLKGEQIRKDIDMGVSLDDETGAKILVYPKRNSSNMLVILATIPPPTLGLEKVMPAFKACFQRNGKVLGGVEVANTGRVTSWDPPHNPAGSSDPPCNEAVYSAADEFAQIAKKGAAPSPEAAPR